MQSSTRWAYRKDDYDVDDDDDGGDFKKNPQILLLYVRICPPSRKCLHGKWWRVGGHDDVVSAFFAPV